MKVDTYRTRRHWRITLMTRNYSLLVGYLPNIETGKSQLFIDAWKNRSPFNRDYYEILESL